MRKIPTLFERDQGDRAHVLSIVTPGCEWVLTGEGVATRKYDGTCMLFDGERWLARREVKPGKAAPTGFQAIETDEVTGKTMGWEPVEQSAFAKWHAEAEVFDTYPISEPIAGGTYELVGEKINGNPEGLQGHLLVRHGYTAAQDGWELETLSLTFDGLRTWLLAHPKWEGIVWRHPDDRMAKLKGRDFAGDRAPL